MSLLSVGVEDEGFVLGDHGLLIRVNELIAQVNAHPSEFIPELHKTSDLMRFRRSDGVCKEHLSGITASRLEEPLLVATIEQELWVVDGNHRLIRRHFDECEQTLAIEVPLDVLLRFAGPLGW